MLTKNKEMINLKTWPGISLIPYSILRMIVFDKLRTHCFIARGGSVMKFNTFLHVLRVRNFQVSCTDKKDGNVPLKNQLEFTDFAFYNTEGILKHVFGIHFLCLACQRVVAC